MSDPCQGSFNFNKIFFFLAGTGLATSASSHALGESSPPISPITMSHTTPSLYPSLSMSHNTTNYQGTTSNLGYLPSSSYNPPLSQQYNSLGHGYTNKPTYGNLNTLGQPIGQSIGQSNLSSITNPLGTVPLQTGTVLGSSLGHTTLGPSTIGAGALGTSSLGTTALGSSIVPTSYSTGAISNSTYTNPLIPSNNTVSMGQTVFNNPSYSNPATSTLNQFNLPYNPVTTSYSNNVTFSNRLSTQLMNVPIAGTNAMSIKLKPLEEVDLGKIAI